MLVRYQFIFIFKKKINLFSIRWVGYDSQKWPRKTTNEIARKQTCKHISKRHNSREVVLVVVAGTCTIPNTHTSYDTSNLWFQALKNNPHVSFGIVTAPPSWPPSTPFGFSLSLFSSSLPLSSKVCSAPSVSRSRSVLATTYPSMHDTIALICSCCWVDEKDSIFALMLPKFLPSQLSFEFFCFFF